jgi:predicted aconitase
MGSGRIGPGQLELDDRDLAHLNGDLGDGAALAMRVLTRVAESMGASRLIDIRSAHVDGCFYVGRVGLDFAEALVAGGAHVSVPTTTNVASVDGRCVDRWPGDPEFAANAVRVMDAYTRLGCSPTWTCAPYQLAHRPSFGEQVAWGESNAISFVNSVIGARTQRYGDFVDIAAAIVGRAPLAGLHLDQGRYGDVQVHVTSVPSSWADSGVFFSLLGHVVGQVAGSRVPVITGVERATEDQLKALGSAAASTGAVALYHVVGVTPEAPTLEACFAPGASWPVVTVTADRLRAAWRELTTGHGGRIAAVCVGTPHFSEAEFEQVVHLLAGRTVHPDTPLYASTGRYVLDRIRERGLLASLEASGVRIVTDTCTYNVPVLGPIPGIAMTNSAKWAWYAPSTIGVDVVFASLRACVETAVTGTIVEDPLD